MENLQEKVSGVPAKVEDRRVEELIKPMTYEGLTLVESANYNGGTSIRYWM